MPALSIVLILTSWVSFAGSPVAIGAPQGGQELRRQPTRAQALQELRAREADPARIAHALAVEAMMRTLADRLHGSVEEWGLAGLLHDIDLPQTRENPARHGIVGAPLLVELGFSEAVAQAVASHDDAAGVPRRTAMGHALYCADRAFWAIRSSGVAPAGKGSALATPAAVVQGLAAKGITNRIDAKLEEACAALGLTLEELLSVCLAASSAVVAGQVGVFDAITRGDEKSVAALLDGSVPLTLTNEHGYSLLHWSVITRKPQIASLLIARGAPVSATGPGGRTPLHDAAAGGDEGVARLLVSAGARAYVADSLGKTPLDLAVENGHGALFPVLKPLHVAAEQGQVDEVRRVLQAEPPSGRARDEAGASALHVAAGAGHRVIAELLVEGGADINARGACGETPLRVASERGRREVAAFLHSRNAEDQSDDLLLRRPLEPGTAIIWHLSDVGWVVRTSAHVLVFDYVPGRQPALPPSVRPCLGNGEIDPAQLRDQNVTVFTSFIRDARHRETILSWRKTIRQIAYVVGDGSVKEPDAMFIPPRTERRVGDVSVLTIPTTGYGEGFVVSVDGVTVFYAGDHQSSDRLWPVFTREVDFLRGRVPKTDVVFLQMMFEEQMSSSRGVLYALEALKPAAMFPNSAVAAEPFFPRFVKAVTDAGLPTLVRSARRRGDVFFYPLLRDAVGLGRVD